MKIIFSILITFLLINLTVQQQSFLNLIKIENQDTAKCLDGSPPSFYYRQGSGKNINNFIIFFESGGWCYGENEQQTIENCYQRSQTNLGSSKFNQQQTLKGGIFDTNNKLNPYFHNYSIIYLNYCDGSSFQGYRQDPIIYKNQNLWFRGEENVKSIINYALQNLNFQTAENILIGGFSAGGLASIIWTEPLIELIRQKNLTANIKAFSDCGIFPNAENQLTNNNLYYIKMKNLYNIVNKERQPVNKACIKNYKGDVINCLFSDVALEYIKTPLLVITSLYDSWIIPNILGVECQKNSSLKDCNEKSMIQLHKNYYYQKTKLLEISENNLNINIWGITCIIHGLVERQQFNDKNWKVTEKSAGLTASDALFKFINNDKIVLIDKQGWPYNKKCSQIINHNDL